MALSGAELAVIISAKDEASAALDRIGEKTGGLGGKLTGLALPALAAVGAVAGIGAAALKIGSDFDTAYDKIRVGTGATGEVLAGLQKDFKEVFAAVPTDMGSASTAIADLNTRLGLTGEPLQTLSKQILEMSRITGTDLGTNITTVTRAFGDWSISTEDMSGAMDTLFKVSQTTGPSIDEIGRLVVQYGAPLRQFGFSFEEAATLMGQFQKQGVNTELVMGSLRIAIGKFAKEGIPLRKGLEDTIKQIQEMGPSAEATALAMEVFGARAGADMADTILAGKFAIEDWVKAVEDSDETILGAAADTADFGEKFALLKNKVLIAVEPLATKMVGALTAFASIILDKVVPALERWIQDIGPDVEAFLSQAGAIIKDQILPALESFWKALQPLIEQGLAWLADHKEVVIGMLAALAAIIIAAVVPAFISLAVTLAPVVAILAVGAGLAIGIKWLIDHWPQVTKAVQGFIEKIEELPVLGAVIEGVKNFLAEAIQAVIDIFKRVVDTGKEIISFFKNIFKGDWSAAWTDLKDIASNLLNIFLDFLKLTWFNLLKNVFLAIVPWDWVKDKLGDFKEKIVELFTNVVDWVKDKLGDFKEEIIKVFTDVVNWVKDHWITLVSGALALFQPWLWVELIVYKFRDEITDIFTRLKDTIVGKLNDWKDAIVAKFNEWVIDWPSRMLAIGRNLVEGIWDGISGSAEALYEKVLEFAKGIFRAVKKGLGKLWPWKSPSEAGEDIVIGLVDGIEAMEVQGKEMANAFGKGFSNAILDGLNEIVRQWFTFRDAFFGLAKGLASEAAIWGTDIGLTFAYSVADGIYSGTGSVIAAAVNMVLQAIAAAKTAAQSASPSKVWMAEGRNWTAGLAEGLKTGYQQTVAPIVEGLLRFGQALGATGGGTGYYAPILAAAGMGGGAVYNTSPTINITINGSTDGPTVQRAARDGVYEALRARGLVQ